jgi:crotonobetaine/carnitine-CoA ligase
MVGADGGVVPASAEGELNVHHSAEAPRLGFFSGYLRNEAATEEAWRGGWFHTGDVARRDASGMLFFVDRKKHIIRRSGENIAAAEVKAVLQEHEAVVQVAVLPVPDDLREEEVPACIVPMLLGAVRPPADDGRAEGAEEPDLCRRRGPAHARRHRGSAGAQAAGMSGPQVASG